MKNLQIKGTVYPSKSPLRIREQREKDSLQAAQGLSKIKDVPSYKNNSIQINESSALLGKSHSKYVKSILSRSRSPSQQLNTKTEQQQFNRNSNLSYTPRNLTPTQKLIQQPTRISTETDAQLPSNKRKNSDHDNSSSQFDRMHNYQFLQLGKSTSFQPTNLKYDQQDHQKYKQNEENIRDNQSYFINQRSHSNINSSKGNHINSSNSSNYNYQKQRNLAQLNTSQQQLKVLENNLKGHEYTLEDNASHHKLSTNSSSLYNMVLSDQMKSIQDQTLSAKVSSSSFHNNNNGHKNNNNNFGQQVYEGGNNKLNQSPSLLSKNQIYSQQLENSQNKSPKIKNNNEKSINSEQISKSKACCSNSSGSNNFSGPKTVSSTCTNCIELENELEKLYQIASNCQNCSSQLNSNLFLLPFCQTLSKKYSGISKNQYAKINPQDIRIAEQLDILRRQLASTALERDQLRENLESKNLETQQQQLFYYKLLDKAQSYEVQLKEKEEKVVGIQQELNQLDEIKKQMTQFFNKQDPNIIIELKSECIFIKEFIGDVLKTQKQKQITLFQGSSNIQLKDYSPDSKKKETLQLQQSNKNQFNYIPSAIKALDLVNRLKNKSN